MNKVAVLFISLMSALTAAESPNPEAGTLIIFTLTVESGYAEEVERPAGKRFDTVQWWIGSSGAWRIKTYAIDSDIHTHRLDTKSPPDELRQLAVENTKKHYGDVIAKMYIVEIPAGASMESICRLLRKENLRDSAEWVPPGYLLWLPDDSHYRTKTRPKEG